MDLYEITGPSGESVGVKRNYNCEQGPCIYAIRCKKCGKLYIGQTKRLLRVRFQEHLGDIRNNRSGGVAEHFNSESCSIDDISIVVLNVEWECKKEKELIEKLGTMDPDGMNLSGGGEGCEED